MILRPRAEDIRNIGYYLGKIIIGLGLAMLIPAISGLLFKEINPALDFIIGSEAALTFGLIITKICRTDKDLTWMQGMIVVSLSWLFVSLFAAIPLYLSGHFKSFLDSSFESMSSFATTGLSLVQDLDHLSLTHNLWRHLGSFIGGQGIAIIALTLFVKGTSGALRIYVGEGREEKLMPNVIHTARFIWLVSFIYFILGAFSLGVTGMFIGMSPFSSFFHAACIFMGSFDTAGFAPQSQSILYYHSFIYEIVIIIIMFLGALNFNFHFQLWAGNRREVIRNIESKAFFISVMLIFFVVAVGLSQSGIYRNALVIFRKGFFHLFSAHTTTGFMTVYAGQFIKEWGDLALSGMIVAMALGGYICSTAGGIKMLRLGVMYKALVQDIKSIMLPEKTVVAQKIHHIKDMFLEDAQVRAAFLITVAYIVLFVLGAFVGMFYGYPFLNSLFESTSAAGNVGLSCGITDAAMPAGLKVTYIIQMWAGRLEFMSIFTLIGFAVAAVRGK